jgi:hypothetical protein
LFCSIGLILTREAALSNILAFDEILKKTVAIKFPYKNYNNVTSGGGTDIPSGAPEFTLWLLVGIVLLYL